MLRKFSLLLSTLFLVIVGSSAAISRDLESNVIVLFDFSNSYFTSERAQSEIPDNLKKLANAVGSKRNGPKAPAIIQVLPINETSEIERPICEYKLLRKKLLGGRKKNCGDFDDEFCSAKTKELKEYIKEDCAELITSRPAENATDISGALALSSQLISGQAADDAYIIIFSDMFEYRNKELPVSKINLTGAKVLVVCGGFFNQETDTMKLCYGTEEQWRSRLKKVGASSVIFTTENVRWTDGIAKEFF